jgi:hypothetical protein
MIETYRNDPSAEVRLYVMMALDYALLPASVPFLAEVLREGDPRCTLYAEQALRSINTPEARAAICNATHTNVNRVE